MCTVEVFKLGIVISIKSLFICIIPNNGIKYRLYYNHNNIPTRFVGVRYLLHPYEYEAYIKYLNVMLL